MIHPDPHTPGITLWADHDAVYVYADCTNVEDLIYGPHLEAGGRDVAREEGWRVVLALPPLAHQTMCWGDLDEDGPDYDVPRWVCLPPSGGAVIAHGLKALGRAIAAEMGVPVTVILVTPHPQPDLYIEIEPE